MDKTIFQNLSSFFKSTDTYSDQYAAYDLDFLDKSLVKTKDRDEFNRLKLQKQQAQYLRDAWKKTNNTIARNTLVYEAQRIPAYFDYEMMSQYDIIGKALEIYTEESCTPNEKGKILNIFSESKRVQNELENLFFNNLNGHTNIPMWIYESIKMGECFLHINLNDENGIVGCRMLPAVEVERIDADYGGKYFTQNPNMKNETYFRWRSEHMVEFRHWQIAHFRLMLDQSAAPYGTSMLRKIRRLYQNIVLAEDSLLSEQILRGIDRLVYYIDTGGIDPDDVPAYIQAVMSRIKRKREVDKTTGQINLKHHVMSIDQDLIIPKRGQNDTSKIDKIEGKKNMDTSVVDFLMKKLIATLGIPKSFLNYDEAVGDGKNLSMLDIRLARTINRIQQCILVELNKIAIIHLLLKGMDDEIDNFQLSFNNPSIQTEVLRIELLQNKINLYRDLTDIGSTGIAAMSNTNAKKKIFNMSDDEILQDIRQQRIERAISVELENTPAIIKYTGIFEDVDALYGDPNVDPTNVTADGELGGGLEGGNVGGGGGGGGTGALNDLGSDMKNELDIGDEGDEETTDKGEQTEGDESLDLGESFNIDYYIDKLILDHDNRSKQIQSHSKRK